MTRVLSAVAIVLGFVLAPAAVAKVAVPGFGRPAPATQPAPSSHVLTLPKIDLARFTPDGRALLTVSDEPPAARFWDVDTGEEVTRLGGPVSGIVLSADGRRALAWGADHGVRLYDVRTGRALRRLARGDDAIRAAALSPDGSRALTCDVGRSAVQLWDTTTGAGLATWTRHAAPVTDLSFSPDGRRAASVSSPATGNASGDYVTPRAATGPTDRTLRLWDVESGRLLGAVDLPSPSHSPAFSKSGNFVRVVTAAGEVKAYDVNTGHAVDAPPAGDPFPAGERTADLRTGLLRTIGGAQITDAVTAQPVRPLEGPLDGLPLCHAFANDGRRVILGTGKVSLFSRNPNEPGRVYVYDVATGRRVAEFVGHAREVTGVAFSADGTHAVSTDADKTLFLWTVPK